MTLLAFLGFGLWLVVNGVYAVRRGGAIVEAEQDLVTTSAVVTALEPWETISYTNRSKTVWSPIVRFTLPDGEVVESRIQGASSTRPPQVGESQTILYDPGDPRQVTSGQGLARPGNLGFVMDVVPGWVRIAAGSLVLVVGGFLALVSFLGS
jgi:hypothetical protein